MASVIPAPERSSLRRDPAWPGYLTVMTVFATAGFLFASWVSRLPEIRDHLQLTPGRLGTVLLIGSLASIASMPVAGLALARWRPARLVAVASTAAALAVIMLGQATSVWLSVIATTIMLAAMNFGWGAWDVSMNVEAAAVEQQMRRTVMPHFHAGFSLGTVLGAGSGAALSALGLPVAWHLGLAGVLVGLLTVGATTRFLPAGVASGPGEGQHAGRGALGSAWRERRTLLIGVMVLALGLTEGTAYDWLSLAVVDGFDVAPYWGGLALAIFVTAMTVARTLGAGLLDRRGRVVVLRLSIGLAFAGVLLVALAPWYPLALVGAVCWGLGAALGFPVGMSAASDDPAKAAVRVSVVSTIAYGSFLVGPTLIGHLGDLVGVRRALLAVLVVIGLAAIVIPAAREPRPVARPGDPVNEG